MAQRIGVARAWPLLAGLAILAAVLTGPAQTPPGGAAKSPAPTPSGIADGSEVRVPVTTADGVELDGTYFRSPKAGKDAPCVILVNKYGTDRSKSDWIALARELQKNNFAVLTFDHRGVGNSTQLSNPQLFWGVGYNRNGIRNGGPKKTTISYTDFKPSYFPFLVNDLAAARRFFEQKNDAGEVNIHSLIVIGAQEGAGLGLLFTAAEYGRRYTIGFNALQSSGTGYDAGMDIAAGVWLSLSTRPSLAGGVGPNFNVTNWVREHPMMKEKTPMCFIFGEKDNKARTDSDAVFRTFAGTRPEKKLDDLHPIKGTDLAGPALLGQPALEVPQYVVKYCLKVMTERRAIPWTEVKWEVNVQQLISPQQFGFRAP